MARKKKENTEIKNENIVKEEIETKQEAKQTPKKVKKQLDRNMLVPVVNFTNGRLGYKSPKTGAWWTFENFGATDEIELSELITMRSAHPKFLSEPWLIILDDEVVEYLGMKDKYKHIILPEKFDKFLNMSVEETEDFLKKAPKGMQELIISKVKQMINNNQFDSIAKKNLIEEIYNVDLEV